MVPNSLSVQLLFNNWTEFGIENNNNMVLRCAFLPVDFDFSILQKILLFFSLELSVYKHHVVRYV